MTTSTGTQTAAPRALHKGAILAIILVSYFMIILDNSVIFTGLPSLQAEFGMSATELAWVQDAYTLVFGGLLLVGARAGDLLGRKRVFIFGLIVFSTASLLIALAPASWFIIAARALQGMGAAIVAPSALALITATFEGEERNRAVAWYSAAAGIGASLGMVVGGAAASLFSWRAGFFINVPIGIAMLLLAPRFLPDGGKQSGRFDVLGALASMLGVGALVVSANDPQAICDALNEARDAGVKVVTFDSDTNPDCRDLFINQATADGIAKVQVDLIAEQIGDAGEVAVLSASANATNQNAWIDKMKELLAADHPNISLVDVVYGDDDDQTSFDKTAALLQSPPDLKGIISPTTVGIAAAARYLSTSDYKGKVALTGLGTPNQMREYVEDGTVTAFVLWNQEDLGYLSAYAAAALIKGDITGKEGDTFEAGKLGSYTVDVDATVLLGDPYVFNKDNIGDFDF